jgi:hypothetical protein
MKRDACSLSIGRIGGGAGAGQAKRGSATRLVYPGNPRSRQPLSPETKDMDIV